MTKSAEKHLNYIKNIPTKSLLNNKVIDLIEKQRKNKTSSSEDGMSKYEKYRNFVKINGKKPKRNG